MTDPWIGILKVLEPDYERLHNMSSKGPYISPEIWQTADGHCALTLQEVWNGARGSDDHAFSSSYLDDAVDWASVELVKWKCNRTAYDTWQFKSKQDAEKFRTLFLLKWTT